MQTRKPFRTIKNVGLDLWRAAQDLIDGIEDYKYNELITDEQKYELFHYVEQIQDCAHRLEKLEVDLDNNYWFNILHKEDLLQAADHRDQMISERPPL